MTIVFLKEVLLKNSKRGGKIHDDSLRCMVYVGTWGVPRCHSRKSATLWHDHRHRGWNRHGNRERHQALSQEKKETAKKRGEDAQ